MSLYIFSFDDMKEFIKTILLVFIVYCIIGVSFEVAIKHVQVKNVYSYKYDYVRSNAGIKNILMGNSFFEFGVNPYLMGDSIFDFAITGRWIYYDVKLAEKLMPTMQNLKTVIFPLGYTIPYNSYHYKQSLSDFHKDQIYNYKRYMNIDYDKFPDNYLYISALYHNKIKIKYMRDSHVDSLGYTRRDAHCEDWIERATFKPDFYINDTAYLCYAEYRDYLKDLARVCYENNVRIVVVTCPCADGYLANVREDGVRQLYDLIDSVRACYPIEYYNYLFDPEFRADSIYFDAAHLNSRGADMFAIRLKNDLGM